MLNEEIWYKQPDINELIKQDKQRQFKRYIHNKCRKIIDKNVLSAEVKRYKEDDGYMYIKYVDAGDGEGNLRVKINEFWDKDVKEINVEEFGRWNCPLNF